MARPNETIIRTADICDDHGDARVCELQFRDFAAREHFHGEVVTFATFEDNKGVRGLIAQGGAGKVLVVDGRGSMRRALCGGIAVNQGDYLYADRDAVILLAGPVHG